jgi:hypothetical protein
MGVSGYLVDSGHRVGSYKERGAGNNHTDSMEDRQGRLKNMDEDIDEKEVMEEHKDAVLGYRWAVNETVVWKEELARKIDNLLPNRP